MDPGRPPRQHARPGFSMRRTSVSTPLVVIATAAVTAVLTALAIWPTIHRIQRRLRVAVWHANHDPLTGLLNRDGLAAFHQHRRDDHPQQALIVAVLDV